MLIMDPGGALGEAGAGVGVAGGAPPEDAIGMATTQHKLQLLRFSQELRASLLLFSANFKDFVFIHSENNPNSSVTPNG